MKALTVFVALVAALALQSTVAGFRIGGTTAVNLVLVVVVYAGLVLGPTGGLAAGTAGGLVQDALAGGIIGVGGFAKTIVGFLVGFLGAQFIVSQAFPRFVMFLGATVVHEACYPGAVVARRGAAVPARLHRGAHAGRDQRRPRHAGVRDRGARTRGASAAAGARSQLWAETLLGLSAIS